MSEWISVKDRLPLEGTPVLTYDKYDGFRVDYIFNTPDEKEPYIWAHRLHTDWEKVTHWMPLPEKPNEK